MIAGLDRYFCLAESIPTLSLYVRVYYIMGHLAPAMYVT